MKLTKIRNFLNIVNLKKIYNILYNMNNPDKNYYECKRCFHRCYQKNDMEKHLNKKNKCERSIKSFNYTEDKLKELSLTRINIIKHDKINNYFCNKCNKNFTTTYSLDRHMKLYCKNVNETEIENTDDEEETEETIDIIEDKNDIKEIQNKKEVEENDEKDLKEEQKEEKIKIEKKTDNPIIKNITDSVINYGDQYNTNNTIINGSQNITFNINVITPFNEKWNTTHIDDKTKLVLLLNNSKFTKTLENILENQMNLNVLLDNTTDKGLVFQDNEFITMDMKEIFNKTMQKLHDQLCSFRDEMINENKLDIDLNTIDYHIKIVKDKYADYRRQDKIQKSVNNIVKNTYNKKTNLTVSNYKNNYGF